MKNQYTFDYGVTEEGKEFWRTIVNGLQRGWVEKINGDFYFCRDSIEHGITISLAGTNLEETFKNLIQNWEE